MARLINMETCDKCIQDESWIVQQQAWATSSMSLRSSSSENNTFPSRYLCRSSPSCSAMALEYCDKPIPPGPHRKNICTMFFPRLASESAALHAMSPSDIAQKVCERNLLYLRIPASNNGSPMSLGTFQLIGLPLYMFNEALRSYDMQIEETLLPKHHDNYIKHMYTWNIWN